MRVDMGRLLAFAVIMGASWLLVNHLGLSIDPRGVGTRVEGREVVRDSGQLEARFSRVDSLEDTYMLFGGDAAQHRNSLSHAIIAGLPMRHARLIAASHPDFHLCKSPGAEQAQRLTENLSLVAADRAVRNALEEALGLYEDRLHGSGERTCIRLRGASLLLDSVRGRENGEDITAEVTPHFERSHFVLAERVKIEDCSALLR
jgi:hypothetical protein